MKGKKICIEVWSPPASFSLKGKVTKHTTVKWTTWSPYMSKNNSSTLLLSGACSNFVTMQMKHLQQYICMVHVPLFFQFFKKMNMKFRSLYQFLFLALLGIKG